MHRVRQTQRWRLLRPRRRLRMARRSRLRLRWRLLLPGRQPPRLPLCHWRKNLSLSVAPMLAIRLWAQARRQVQAPSPSPAMTGRPHPIPCQSVQPNLGQLRKHLNAVAGRPRRKAGARRIGTRWFIGVMAMSIKVSRFIAASGMKPRSRRRGVVRSRVMTRARTRQAHRLASPICTTCSRTAPCWMTTAACLASRPA